MEDVQRLTQGWVGHRKVQTDEEEESEACFLLHARGRATCDTDCGRCFIGADTLEDHQIKLGDFAHKMRWHEDPTPVTFY